MTLARARASAAPVLVGGMRHLNFDMDLQFDDPSDKWLSEQILLFGLMILAARNYHYLKAHPETLGLYDSGMIYKLPEQITRQPTDAQIRDFKKFLATRMGMGPVEILHHVNLSRGVEIFRDIKRMQENGGGDCDNWAAARAAWLAVYHPQTDAVPYMTSRPRPGGGGVIYHALVLHRRDGSHEDPSIIQGMGGWDKRAERREECRKNVERYDRLWQAARARVARLPAYEREAAAVAYAEMIDRCGYLPGNYRMHPRDRIFRVGQASPVKVDDARATASLLERLAWRYGRVA